MDTPQLWAYPAVGAVATLLVLSALRPMRSGRKLACWAGLAFVGLLVVALVLPDLKRSAGNVVVQRLLITLCGVALVAVLRLLWAAWQDKRPGRKLLLVGLAGILVILVTLSLPSFVTVRVSSSRNACMANLAAIQGAKESWAREHKKDPTDVPWPADLIGSEKYIRATPVCPAGGSYRLGAVREKATCSVSSSGHTLDSNR